MSKFSSMHLLKNSLAACHRAAMTAAALVALAVGVGATPGRSAPQLDATAAPVRLQTQLRADPLAVNSVHPQLGWMLPWKGRGEFQSAYEILVASSPERLEHNQGNIWNSGKVLSDQSINIRYAGSPLKSRQRCFWKVRVWNQAGEASHYSAVAQWQEGLLQLSDWKHARWIGMPTPKYLHKVVLRHDQWIWYPDGQPATAAPVGKCYFQRIIDLPAKIQIRKAFVAMTADNGFILWINGRRALQGSDFQVVSTANLAMCFHPGRNVVTVTAINTGSTPNPAGLVGHIHFTLADGKNIVVSTNSQWQAAQRFHGAWKSAMLLGSYGMAPWGTAISSGRPRSLPARYLRRDFTLNEPVKRAVVYFSGLGWSQLFINGHRVSKDQLSPALSWYPRRCYYRTYDVTRFLHQGKNTLGVILGDGRFYAPRLRVPAPTVSFGSPRLILRLHVRLANGSIQSIVSNNHWKTTDRGPIVANNEYDGEVYDARLQMPGWDQPGFNAASWQSATLLKSPGGRLVSQFSQSIQVTRILHPIKLAQIAPGKWIFDMGQNMAGWCQITVPNAPAGTMVILRHGESLTRNGKYTVDLNTRKKGRIHLFVANLRSAKQTDTLILNGKGPITWHPIFTTHGFRFVELTGYPGTPTLSTLEGQDVHDALPVIGGFACSDKLVNQIVHNWRWTTQNNYRSIPSDCPQRDERQGWMGDRSEESLGETFAFNNERFYELWLWDMQDGQKPNGSISDVNPPYWQFYNNDVTWPSTFIFLPANLYNQFGRLSIIRDHYTAEKKWILMELTFIHHGITSKDSYGDWCSPSRSPKHIHSRDPKRSTPGPLLASVTLYQDLKIMARYASLLHKNADQRRWLAAAASIRAGINRSLWNEQKHYYGNGSDTSCILPLAAGVVPPSRRGDVIRRLLYRINVVQHGHVGSGLIGGQWLFRTLTRIGQAQVAWNMLNKTTYPGWGYMVKHGATTIWELWNGNTANPAMNSQDHDMLIGDMIAWLFEDVGGIKSDPRDPGFHHIILRPLILHGLTWVKTWHRSPYGKIVSDWKIQSDGNFLWHVRVPANSFATVEVPASGPNTVRLDGHTIRNKPWIKFVAYVNGRAIYRLESGDYRFQSELMKMSLLPVTSRRMVAQSASTGMTHVPVAGPDTWGAVDALGRVLPVFRQVGPPRAGKTVGIFYFTANNQPGHPILNNAAILAKNPNAVIGPLNSEHWWGKPLFGFYISSDPFVLREHAAMLGDAGINTVIFDNTNGPTYFNSVQKTLFKTWLRMKALGNAVPDFVCFAGHGAWNADYKNIYKTGLAKKLWFYWDGKPLMLIHGNMRKLPATIRHFFTLRYCWAWTGEKNRWGWDNTGVNPWLYSWHINPHIPEEMPACVAGWANTTTGRSYFNGHEPPLDSQHPGSGMCFAQQWQHVLKVNPSFVFITGWNEWTAGCWPEPGRQFFAGHWVNKGAPIFIDEYSPEYSRDAEPMRSDKGGLYGGFGDNYYYQMISYIRRYKGVEPLPFVHPTTISVNGSFSQWKNIGPLFTNNVGLAVHRNSPGWGTRRYVNNTGRNDIVASKCTYDLKNVYFWVKTRKALTSWRDKSWMLLFLHIPHPGSKTWMGYNYVIDRRVISGRTSVVERNVNGKYQWRAVGRARIGIKGDQMQMAIPRTALGIAGFMPNEIHFKWADNIRQNGSWTDFYLNGDCGPPFRFYYRAKIR